EGRRTAPTKMETSRPRGSWGLSSLRSSSAIGFRMYHHRRALGVTRLQPGVKGCQGHASITPPARSATMVAVAKPAADGQRLLASNRKALFNYEVLERAEAGISLVGTEVKSIREGGLNFRDSYVQYRGGELFLVGARIGPYSHGNLMNHAEDRERRLLLHK